MTIHFNTSKYSCGISDINWKAFCLKFVFLLSKMTSDHQLVQSFICHNSYLDKYQDIFLRII